MHRHVTVLAALYLGFSILLAAIGVLMVVGLLPIMMTVDRLLTAVVFPGGNYSTHPEALPMFMRQEVSVGCLLLLLSLSGILGGIGLFRRRGWARTLVLILGAIHLFNIPIGTLLGIYTIWVLSREETKHLFERSAAA